jgi:phage-related protein
VQIIGEASIRLRLLSSDLKKTIKAEVSDALKEATESTNSNERSTDNNTKTQGRYRKALFESSSILGGFKKLLDATTGSGDANGSMWDRIKEKSKDAAEKGVRGFGRIFDEVFTGKSVQGAGLKMLGTIGSGVFSVLTSKALLMGGAISAGIGAVGGAVAAFPALAVVGGAAMGAIKLGMDGIKKAASGLTPAIDTLKSKVSAVFAKEMKPAFQDIGKILPTVQAGLVGMASSVSGVFKQITSSLKAPEALADLKTALGGASSFVANLGDGLTDMFTSILHSAATVAPVMDDMGAAIGGLFSTISGAFNRAANTGKLLAAFRGFRQVIDAVSDVLGPLLDLVFDFAAQLGGPVASVLSGVGGALKGALPGLHQFGAGIATALNSVAPVLKSLGPLFGQLAGVVGGVFGQVIKALAPALKIIIDGLSKALAPVLPVLSKAFADLAVALAPVLAQFAGVFVQVLQVLAPLIPIILDAIQQLTPSFLALVQALLPLLPPLAQLIATILPPLIQLFVTILRPVLELATIIVTKLTPAIQKILTIVASVVVGVVNFFNNLSTNLAAIFGKIGGFFASIWEGIKTAFLARIRLIVDTAKTIWSAITGFFTDLFNRVKGAIATGIGKVASGVSTGFKSVVQFFKDLPSKLLGALGDLGSLLFEAGKAILQGLLNGLLDIWNHITGFFSGIGSWIADHKGPLSVDRKLLIPAGRAIMNGLQAGLQQEWGNVQSYVASRIPALASAMGKVLDGNLANLWTKTSPATLPSITPPSGTTLRQLNPDGTSTDLDKLAEAVAKAMEKIQVVVSGREVTSKVNKINSSNAGR